MKESVVASKMTGRKGVKKNYLPYSVAYHCYSFLLSYCLMLKDECKTSGIE